MSIEKQAPTGAHANERRRWACSPRVSEGCRLCWPDRQKVCSIRDDRGSEKAIESEHLRPSQATVSKQNGSWRSDAWTTNLFNLIHDKAVQLGGADNERPDGDTVNKWHQCPG